MPDLRTATADLMQFPVRQPRAQVFDELRTVLSADGPYLSVYLDLGNDAETVTERLRRSVDPSSVPARVIEHVAQLAQSAVKSGDGLFACIAASAGPLMATTFPEPPARDLIEVGPVPRLAPFVESEQTVIHHVVAMIDEAGMTLVASPRHGPAVRETLIGHNPEGAAELISQVAQLTGTAMVIIAGPAQMLDAVHPIVVRDGRLLCPVIRVETDDAPDGLADEVVRMIADRSARRVVEILRLFRYFESHEASAHGVIATIEALRSGTASLLLVHGDPDDDRQAWFGNDFDDIGFDIADLPPGDQPRLNGRLVDVVLRAAVGTKVPVMIVPAVPDDSLADGMGVLLATEGFADADLTELVEQ